MFASSHPFIILLMSSGIAAQAPAAVVFAESRGNETRQQVMRYALQQARHSQQAPVQLMVCLIEKEVSEAEHQLLSSALFSTCLFSPGLCYVGHQVPMYSDVKRAAETSLGIMTQVGLGFDKLSCCHSLCRGTKRTHIIS